MSHDSYGRVFVWVIVAQCEKLESVLLEYTQWRRFEEAIQRAMTACDRVETLSRTILPMLAKWPNLALARNATSRTTIPRVRNSLADFLKVVDLKVQMRVYDTHPEQALALLLASNF